MKKTLSLLFVLAALLSSCGRAAAPAAMGTAAAPTAAAVTAEAGTAPRLSLPELQAPMISAIPTETARRTTAASAVAVPPAHTTARTTGTTAAASFPVRSAASAATAAATGTAARYAYTNHNTTTARPGTARSTAAPPAAATTRTARASTEAATTKRTQAGSVSFAVDGSAAAPYGYDVSLPARAMTLGSGESVLDLLLRSGVEVESGRSFLGVYVSGIGGLREKACGGTSGWVYEVNGTRPGASCDKYKPKDGDAVVWRYSLTP